MTAKEAWMSEQDRPPPAPATHRAATNMADTSTAGSRRAARLDAALRANLKRRKSQIRSRGLTGDDTSRDIPSIVKASRTDRE